jgi:hypothetical protein
LKQEVNEEAAASFLGHGVPTGGVSLGALRTSSIYAFGQHH